MVKIKKKEAKSKVCGTCELRKPIDQFGKVAGKYRNSNCKKCHGISIAKGQKKARRAAAQVEVTVAPPTVNEAPRRRKRKIATEVAKVNGALAQVTEKQDLVATISQSLAAMSNGATLHSIQMLEGNRARVQYIKEEIIELAP